MTGGNELPTIDRARVEDTGRMDCQHMSLPELVDACRTETTRYVQREPSCEDFCREIIRRAVCERDELAWQAFIDNYHRLVLQWIRRWPVAFQIEDDPDFWVFRTFDRYWGAVDARLFHSFSSLAQALEYLKTCARSAIIEELRRRKREAEGPLSESLPDTRAGTDQAVLDRLTAEDLAQAVMAEVRNERERLVVQLHYMLDYSPAQLHVRHPDIFPTRGDVYTTIRNLKERLQRRPAIRQFLAALDDTTPPVR